MDSNKCIKVIESYIVNLCGPPENWPRRYFSKISHSKWIAEEILRTLKECPDIEPEIIFEEYISKMDYFATTNPDSKSTFEDARDTAYEIQKLFDLKGDY